MCLNPLTLIVEGEKRIVPCGKCIECLEKYSSDWALRCMLEAKKHKDNAFVTLTYNDANLPEGASLRKRDLQLFMKRLRKQLSLDDIKIRFYACGEYGGKHNRPHYHIIIFGYNFPDKYYWKTDENGFEIFRSPLLERCWKFGFSSLGELSFKSAKYCCKYLQVDFRQLKKRTPQFTLMSRRPGLALDVIPKTVFSDGVLYYEGKRIRAPKAFMRVVRNEFPQFYEKIQYQRLPYSEKLRLTYSDKYGIWHDESLEQLYLYNYEIEYKERLDSLQRRRKRVKDFFGKCIDKFYRPVLLFNQMIKTMRKSK